jgi:hypothetical protein
MTSTFGFGQDLPSLIKRYDGLFLHILCRRLHGKKDTFVYTENNKEKNTAFIGRINISAIFFTVYSEKMIRLIIFLNL